MKKPTLCGLLASALTFVVAGGAASDNPSPALEYNVMWPDKREPEGTKTIWFVTTNTGDIVFHFHNDTSGSNWIVKLGPSIMAGQYVTASAGEREPKGSTNLYYYSFDNRNISCYLHNMTSGSNWLNPGMPPPITLPHTFKDEESGVNFRVEGDGRHVTATAPDGTILWRRDPFADAHLEFNHTSDPRVVSFRFGVVRESDPPEQRKWMENILPIKGVKEYKFIQIHFNSSQTGFLDMKTGDFIFTGQL